ncbi:MAG: hypothetical protein ACQET7_03295 [Thermodesulfobacteriota bacterium]
MRTVSIMEASSTIRRSQTFDALEWLAAMCSHVPNKGEHMVGYYGYYSNVCRGKMPKTAGIPNQCLISENEEKAFNPHSR